jgi:hypothetical protein
MATSPDALPDDDAALKLPRPTRHAPRGLVVLRAGDASLHRDWIADPERSFDLFISYYGRTPGRYADEADHYEHRPGPKWPAIAALLHERPTLLDDYSVFWFPDDDLAVDTLVIERMFAFFRAYDLSLAQPALTPDSFHTWNTLLQDPACELRYAGFVEVMAPIFSRAALRVCLPTFGESRSGWGLDWVWPTLCRDAGLERLAVIDATPVHHTRPPGGELYRNHPELDPRRDAEQVLAHYGVQEVRATAKYSFGDRVQARSLPWSLRTVYWLKRLNGRRKYLARR